MKAEIQKIGAGETYYFNVTIDGLQMGVFKFSSDTHEWRYSASSGSKNSGQLFAIYDDLCNLNGSPARAETNKPVKGY